MYQTVKVAVSSMRSVRWDKEANADTLEEFYCRAAKEGASIAVSVEAALEGYVVMDVVAGLRSGEDMLAIAEPIDGPYIKRFQGLARRLKMCLCLGFAEREGRDCYNSAIFVNARGRILGKHRKTQFQEGYHKSWYFNRIGRKLRAFDTPFGRMGFIICNERWNPMIARTLVMDGARALLILSYGSNSRRQNQAVIDRARENGVPIAESNKGNTLIVDKGEPVAYHWGHDAMTLGEIGVSLAPSVGAARKMEREYLVAQEELMAERYEGTLKRYPNLKESK